MSTTPDPNAGWSQLNKPGEVSGQPIPDHLSSGVSEADVQALSVWASALSAQLEKLGQADKDVSVAIESLLSVTGLIEKVIITVAPIIKTVVEHRAATAHKEHGLKMVDKITGGINSLVGLKDAANQLKNMFFPSPPVA